MQIKYKVKLNKMRYACMPMKCHYTLSNIDKKIAFQKAESHCEEYKGGARV